MTNENYGAEEWRQPDIQQDDKLLFSEHGRVLNDTCYRSYWFKVVHNRFDSIDLIVKHGGGTERRNLGYKGKFLSTILERLTSDERFFILFELYDTHKQALNMGYGKASILYQQAFLDGRLKKKKRNNYISVVMEPVKEEVAA